MIRLQFEAGNGVNILDGEDENLAIYAEVKVPEGASEDYGYLTMKKEIEKRLPAGVEVSYWYDGQEQYLAPDAAADAEVYVEIEVDE